MGARPSARGVGVAPPETGRGGDLREEPERGTREGRAPGVSGSSSVQRRDFESLISRSIRLRDFSLV